MTIHEHAQTTRTIWKFIIIGMVVLAIFLSDLEGWLVVIYAMMLGAGVLATLAMWEGSLGKSLVDQERTEKQKRERLDNVLRELSTQELQILRQRLSEGAITDDDLHYLLGDDGELTPRQIHGAGGMSSTVSD